MLCLCTLLSVYFHLLLKNFFAHCWETLIDERSSLRTDPFAESSDVLYIATTIAQMGYNIKQCTIQIEKYREIEYDEAAAEQKSHTIVSETENPVVNILS